MPKCRWAARAGRRSGSVSLEALESRVFFSVSTDAGGWTVVSPSGDSRVIYVSSSGGSDQASGTSASSALRSVRAGVALLRDGFPDQLLLKRGDVFDTLGLWRKSGRSASQPMVVGAFGQGSRPLLNSGNGSGFTISGGPLVGNLDLLGLDFHADTRDPASPTFGNTANNVGIQVSGKAANVLIEDCAVRDFGVNVNLLDADGPARNITIRRSQVLDAYSPSSAHSEGLFADGIAGLTLEENVFDHNGWNEAVPGAGATIFNHNVYITARTSSVVAHGNLFANASSHGMQARSGGDIQNNLFFDNPIGLSFGLVRGSPPVAGGVSGVVNGNVFAGSRDISGAPRGMGLELANTTPGDLTLVSNNIFAHDAGGSFPAILLEYSDGPDGAAAVGINDLTLQGNVVYDWKSALSFAAGMAAGGQGPQSFNNLVVRGNDFQNIRSGLIVDHRPGFDSQAERWSSNRYSDVRSGERWISVGGSTMAFNRWSQDDETDARAMLPPYADASRTIDAYATSLSAGGSARALLAAARSQSSQSWQPADTALAAIDYMRAGFTETTPGLPPRDWRPPTPPDAVAALPDSVTTADAGLTFTVTYTDDKAVDVSSLGTGNLTLVGRNGSSMMASLLAVSGGGAGPVVATYSIAAPAGAWRRGDRGIYHLMMDAAQVRDTDGFYVPAESLAKIKLHVARAPKPPVVKRVKLHGRTPQSLSIKFSSDVAGTVNAADLLLTAQDGSAVDPSLMAMTYDPRHRVATWTFPGFPAQSLPAGEYQLTLRSSSISDATGLHLDGNKDGLGGDDFVLSKLLRIKPARV